MNYKKKLEELVNEKHGTVLSSDLDKRNIPRTYLQLMVAEGKLEKIGRGIYVSVDSIEDEMYAMQRKYPKLIYSHETALFVHGLSDRTPFIFSASVPSGYKVVPNISEKFKIYYIKKELHQIGVEEAKSSFGNPIKIYGMEKTICDILKSRERVDIQILNDALKRFVKLTTADYSLLMQYAKQLNIETSVKHYLEVLI
ncbi:MAG: type IV toxin-antitoxin system AbiEi family antitoxin domain-containing protein [Anaerolineaceae bacterium]|nr:type IV toxin-antitoxin system AbiEi family antitoxin domain-containing protein [Anaerolineaceae bacterium]